MYESVFIKLIIPESQSLPLPFSFPAETKKTDYINYHDQNLSFPAHPEACPSPSSALSALPNDTSLGLT
jgi:hypothetical protein